MLMTNKKQQGLSLIELMIGLTIGLILTGIVLKIYITSVKSSSDNLNITMLNQELRSLLHLIDHDVRRAGFWAAVPGTDDLSTDPFMSSPNDLNISATTGEAANSCITYSYDLDKDKLVDVGTSATAAPFNAAPYDSGNIEQYGFRLNGTSVEMRTGLASASESSFDCNSGAWTGVTDSNTEITGLDFNLTTQYLNVTNGAACSPATTNCCTTGQACQLIRDVSISITGRIVNDPNVVKTVTASTRIRNDKYIVIP